MTWSSQSFRVGEAEAETLVGHLGQGPVDDGAGGGALEGRRLARGTSLLLYLLPAIAGSDPDVDAPRPAAEASLGNSRASALTLAVAPHRTYPRTASAR